MTSNMALEEIHQLLNQADQYDENIRMSRTVGMKIEFLDVSIENDRGRLRTTVHHKPAAEPYIVPFLSDHPRHIHRNTIIGALFRAIRLCSGIDDFDRERLDIEVLLLLNGYPPRSVQYHMNRFLQRYQATSLIHEPYTALYNALHQQLLYQPTRRERSMHRNLEFDENPDGAILQQKIKAFLTFESGRTRLFKRRLSELWKQYHQYPGSPLKQVTLLLAMRSNPSLNRLLVHKKPPLHQLKHENPRGSERITTD